jgi:hypothetical protein
LRDASPFTATACSQIGESFVRHRIQSTRGDIALDLAVPLRGVEFGKPRPKCGKFGGGEPQNSVLDFL